MVGEPDPADRARDADDVLDLAANGGPTDEESIPTPHDGGAEYQRLRKLG